MDTNDIEIKEKLRNLTEMQLLIMENYKAISVVVVEKWPVLMLRLDSLGEKLQDIGEIAKTIPEILKTERFLQEQILEKERKIIEHDVNIKEMTKIKKQTKVLAWIAILALIASIAVLFLHTQVWTQMSQQQ